MKVFKIIGDHKIKFVSLLFVLLFFLVYFSQSIFIYIYPGQAGILFQALSADPLSNERYDPGLYTVAPWNRMYIYDVTKQKKTLDVDALTKNGLFVELRISSIFHPNPDELKELTTHIGTDYIEKILVPAIYASAREVVGKYLPEDLYTTAMDRFQEQILRETQRELTGLPFLVEEVVVEKVELPGPINKAIENKLKLQQDALAYEFILKKEQDEAKRREIEANSINAYQKVVNESLNDDLLRWMKIRTLGELGKSDNSKIIVFEGESGRMPLLLNPSGDTP